MGKKVLFSFAGTSISAEDMEIDAEKADKKVMNNDVIRVYFNGCHDVAIGGKRLGLGNISPNLDVVTNKVKQCFNDSSKKLSLRRLSELFGNSIIIRPKSAIQGNEIEIESLYLQGFSRGAVTTFACAKALDYLTIPMSIYAREPVPGDSHKSKQTENSEYLKNTDLSKVENIETVEIMLGTYQKDKGSSVADNKYFRQMAPKFKPGTNVKIYTTPKNSHGEPSALSDNNYMQFLIDKGIHTENEFMLSTELERLYPIPKVLQQKNHTGLVGRVQSLPAYKNSLKKALPEHLAIAINNDTLLTTIHTLLALSTRYESNEIQPLLLVLAFGENAAARDFIIEVDAISKAFLEEIRPKVSTKLLIGKEKIKYDGALQKYGVIKKTVNLCLIKVDDLLIEFTKLQKPTLKECEIFSKNVATQLDPLGKVTYFFHSRLMNGLNEYLKEAPLIHPGLVAYIDESETVAINHFLAGAKALDGNDLKSVREFTTKLYHSSKNKRASVYEAHVTELLNAVTSAQDIADIAQFSNETQLEKLLKNESIKEKISSAKDVCLIMRQLPVYKNRKRVFKMLDMASLLLGADDKVKNELKSYLSEHKQGKVDQLVEIKQGQNKSFFEEANAEKMEAVIDDLRDLPIIEERFSTKISSAMTTNATSETDKAQQFMATIGEEDEEKDNENIDEKTDSPSSKPW